MVRRMTSVRRPVAASPVASSPRQPEVLKGKVTIKLVAKGSKSERRSLVMTSKGRTIQIQRRGGNPFEIDARERALAGKTVALKGYFVSDHLFRYVSASVPKT